MRSSKSLFFQAFSPPTPKHIMENILLLIAGVIIGTLSALLLAKWIKKDHSEDRQALEKLKEQHLRLEAEKTGLMQQNIAIRAEYEGLRQEYRQMQELKEGISNNLSVVQTRLEGQTKTLEGLQGELSQKNEEIRSLQTENQFVNNQIARANALTSSLEKENKGLEEKNAKGEQELQQRQKQLLDLQARFTEADERNKNLQEKLDTQKQEVEQLGMRFSNEFKNLAHEILEDKSKRFTELNQSRIKEILDPLGTKIEEFKTRIDENHKRDIADRASIQERIRYLVETSNKLSTEANNLTNALKGSVKKQGDWGEMILENILEASGLTKGREYVVQSYLRDDNGNVFKDENGSTMRPDVIINYPDNRKVIIDSKVSLAAYERYCSAEDAMVQQKELKQHIEDLKNHINGLSAKNYQNFAPTLDFVMLFVPIEPAYLVAIQQEPELWNFAYKKRILLISPTNLITALKLVADLWQRENQNRNALAIADRGARLYDKFVNFTESLLNIGSNLEKSQKSYDDALKQLKTGSGNLIGQAEKLRKLGVKSKDNKNLSTTLLEDTDMEETEME